MKRRGAAGYLEPRAVRQPEIDQQNVGCIRLDPSERFAHRG
jgi:hypothetical protein